jgi:acetolactate synthase-1/3 small subunit
MSLQFLLHIRNGLQSYTQKDNSSPYCRYSSVSLHLIILSPQTNGSIAQWSAAQAVSNILYETPLPSQTPPKRHVLNCLVQNEPGVLSRVLGILAARGMNTTRGFEW